MASLDRVTIYTDGGASPNPGPGGWAALLIAESGVQRELSGAEPHTTNNRMELTAAVEALRALKHPCDVTLYTDSEYLRRGITEWLPAWQANGWQRARGHKLSNQDLWQALAAESRRHRITWQWIKGHAGNPHNERVDRLAAAARAQLAPSKAPTPPAAAATQIALRVSALPGGRGGWAARLSVPGADAPRVLTGRVDAATSNQLELLAALGALRECPEGTAVHVYCPSDYLYQGITRWIAGWKARGWTTKTGDPVQHADLWRTLEAEARRREVHWAPARETPADQAEGLDRLAAQAARGEQD